MSRYKLGAVFVLMVQVLLIIAGVFVLTNNPDLLSKIIWSCIIAINFSFGIVNIKTIVM